MLNEKNWDGVEDGEPDLWELLSRLWRGRLFIGASVVFFVAIFAAVALLMTPVYQAAAVLAPANRDRNGSLGSGLGSLGSLASIVGIGSMGGTQTEEALAVLRSREFSEGFITDHNLMPVLFARKWDVRSKSWRVAPDKQPTLAKAYKRLNELRTAVEDKKSGLIKVQLEWVDPQQGATLVNAMVSRLNAVMRARAIEKSDAYIGYLQQELGETAAVETRAAIGRLMESQINQRMLANVADEYAFSVVDKALVPDIDDPVRPQKLLLVALGATAGLIVGVVAVFVRHASRRRATFAQRSRADAGGG